MPRRVLVIGGGAAGMTAAFRLAQQGHHISVVDESERLGGWLAASGDSFPTTAVPPVVLTGWHPATEALLTHLGADSTDRLLRRPPLHLRTTSGRLVAWHHPPLP